MEDNVLEKIVKNVKSKLHKKDKSYPSMEYAFSKEEINDLMKNNQEKISNLKNNNLDIKKKEKEKDILDSVLSPIEGTTKIDTNININESKELNNEEETLMDITKRKEETNSFINLSTEKQIIIMQEWKNIDTKVINKDILDGKELINRNYTGIYADEAMRYIHNIRKKYETVITYLIGFNNEKKGFNNKIFFSDNKEEEWKYLSNYIKVLEKIVSNK